MNYPQRGTEREILTIRFCALSVLCGKEYECIFFALSYILNKLKLFIVLCFSFRQMRNCTHQPATEK